MARLIAFRRISIFLAIFIFLAPPVVFSQNLATVCHLFYQKQGKPSGPCGHKALLPKVSPIELGTALTSSLILEAGHSVFAPTLLPDLFALFAVQPNSIPLRC
jgi:hypothetical protein